MALMVKAQAHGDNVGWHFDGCESVVSIMLQRADEGGAFEYAPFIRDDADENYEAVQVDGACMCMGVATCISAWTCACACASLHAHPALLPCACAVRRRSSKVVSLPRRSRRCRWTQAPSTCSAGIAPSIV